jgi:hypothetical protein
MFTVPPGLLGVMMALIVIVFTGPTFFIMK